MKKKIYKFVCDMWTFIRTHDIPTQNDNDAWDKVVDDATELTKEYQTSDPLHRLFRTWVMAYLDYMSAISKGVPTLMQECNQVKEGI